LIYKVPEIEYRICGTGVLGHHRMQVENKML